MRITTKPFGYLPKRNITPSANQSNGENKLNKVAALFKAEIKNKGLEQEYKVDKFNRLYDHKCVCVVLSHNTKKPPYAIIFRGYCSPPDNYRIDEVDTSEEKMGGVITDACDILYNRNL